MLVEMRGEAAVTEKLRPMEELCDFSIVGCPFYLPSNPTAASVWRGQILTEFLQQVKAGLVEAAGGRFPKLRTTICQHRSEHEYLRQKDYVHNLERRCRAELEEKRARTALVKSLEDEVSQLKNMLISQSSCNCSYMQRKVFPYTAIFQPRLALPPVLAVSSDEE